jgi:RNA polymerase sigma factor (TIGR02999 family)
MRRILVDRARANLAAKRGGIDAKRVPAAELHAIQEPPDVNVLALDAALSRLETVEPRWSRLVELRFFVGLSVEETAATVGLSPATVKRDWSLARAWLYREMGAGGNAASRESDCASEHLSPVGPGKAPPVD